MKTSDLLPPSQALVNFGRAHPGLWEWAETAYITLYPQLRQHRSFVNPVHFETRLNGGNAQSSISADAVVSATMAAWRLSQGVYRFDKDFAHELLTTPITGDIPMATLTLLPELCPYIEVPITLSVETDSVFTEEENHRMKVIGFWFSVYPFDLEANKRFLTCIVLLGDDGKVEPAWFILDKDFHEARVLITRNGMRPLTPGGLQQFAHPFLSMVLYLCAENSEKVSLAPPYQTSPTKTKKGTRYFPPSKPSLWEVGYRIGAAIRASEQSQSTESPRGGGVSQRPHLRRAHWHSFWSGPRSPELGHLRRLSVRWMHPVLVNAESPEDLVATIRSVKGSASEEALP